MSKYMKIEDVIERLDYCIHLANTGFFSFEEMMQRLRNEFLNLPTIEVSEDAISRGNLISDLAGIWDTYTPNNMTDFQDMLEDIDYKIRNAPLVIPKPKEGEWVKVDDSVQPICSRCGMSCSGIHRNTDYSVVPTWNFCPNCGSRMKGADDDRI